jgi:transposase
MSSTRTSYPSDVSVEEWAVVALYLVLLAEDAPRRRHALREVFNGLRYIVRTGAQWRMMPHDLPPWPVVYQQTRRWVVERDVAWSARFRRLVRDYERLPTVLAGLHVVVFACLRLGQLLYLTSSA